MTTQLTLQSQQDWIMQNFVSATKGSNTPSWVQSTLPSPDSRNEAVVFIKPELTALGAERLPTFLQIFDAAFKSHNVEITNIGCLSGSYLRQHQIILDHYGVMTAASYKGMAGISPESQKKVLEAFGVPADCVYGGHQFLEKFPAFNTESLNVLWDLTMEGNVKIAPGTYAAKIQYGTTPIVIINGSHPGTVEHYCGDGRALVIMTVRSNTPWASLRDDMIGLTNVAKAAPTSIRGQFLARQAELGIPVVTPRYNGVHMSAGPLEGMVELIRFASNRSTGTSLAYGQTNFGAAMLAAGNSTADLDRLCQNPLVSVNGKNISAFDATEHMDMAPAITTLGTALKAAA